MGDTVNGAQINVCDQVSDRVCVCTYSSVQICAAVKTNALFFYPKALLDVTLCVHKCKRTPFDMCFIQYHYAFVTV